MRTIFALRQVHDDVRTFSAILQQTMGAEGREGYKVEKVKGGGGVLTLQTTRLNLFKKRWLTCAA
jgi:hypothetical protein